MSVPRARVLIVNDDAALASSVRSLLVDTGYDVEIALDGAEGLGALARWQADVVLLDLIMPRMDGWTFLATLRGEDEVKRPAVVVWSVASAEELERARVLGAVECLPRSKTGPTQLLDAIERHAAARPVSTSPARNA